MITRITSYKQNVFIDKYKKSIIEFTQVNKKKILSQETSGFVLVNLPMVTKVSRIHKKKNGIELG